MSVVLQVALIMASLAIVVLVACLVPLLFLSWRQIKQLALTAESLKISLESLILDSRGLVRNAKHLSERADQNLENINHVVHTVDQWTQRADRLVNELGSAIEPPVFLLLRNVNRIRTVISTFFLRLLPHRQVTQSNEPIRKEGKRV
jgi:uncharacterized protein YoxC